MARRRERSGRWPVPTRSRSSTRRRCRTPIASCGCTASDEVAHAIRSMQVRGAPLIGVTAAYGVALALARRADDATLLAAVADAGRDAADGGQPALGTGAHAGLLRRCHRGACRCRVAEAGTDCRRGRRPVSPDRRPRPAACCACRRAARRLEIMTHCNAGWLATVDHGTALAPVYAAFDAGIDVHVWVSETRPRNQGLLTAWELASTACRIPLIADNAAGLLLRAAHRRGDRRRRPHCRQRRRRQQDRHLPQGAGGARRRVPFYVAAPRSTIDFACAERRGHPDRGARRRRVALVHGRDAAACSARRLRQLPADEAVANPAFDVTPAKLVSA
jgi:methylthioribose-1-phosphate isomerase